MKAAPTLASQRRLVEVVEVLALRSQPMDIIVCPARRNRGQREALWQVEWEDIRPFLDTATGQIPDHAKIYLREIVTRIERGIAPPDWRDRVATEYPQLVDLLDYVFKYDFYGEPREPVRSGHNRGLTGEECKLITAYLPLVRKLAVHRASSINNLAGGTALDHALLAHLEDIGMQVLEEQVCRWERTRGVTFGAFVRRRVAGAMDNYLSRKRIKTENLGEDPIDNYSTSKQIECRAARSPDDPREQEKWEADRKRTKDNRTSTGGRKVKSYAESPAPHPPRLIKKNSIRFGAELAGALAQLTPNQRAVYESRVLAEPQVSLGELAAKLGVTKERIVVLEKNARWRMNKLLQGGI
jgi:DNA-directed RNA polymerase specialized sigma subunit